MLYIFRDARPHNFPELLTVRRYLFFNLIFSKESKSDTFLCFDGLLLHNHNVPCFEMSKIGVYEVNAGLKIG